MEKLKLTHRQQDLIERFGVSLERAGVTPAQARISALLLVCDAAELTFEEICQALKMSKSAASNAINALLMMERIGYQTKPGDRKRYFSSRLSQIEADFEKGQSKLLEMNVMLKEILAIRPKATKQFNDELKRVIDFMEFLQTELPGLYNKWRETNK